MSADDVTLRVSVPINVPDHIAIDVHVTIADAIEVEPRGRDHGRGAFAHRDHAPIQFHSASGPKKAR